MVTRYGMSDNIGNLSFGDLYDTLSTETRRNIETEVRSMTDAAYARAFDLLKSKRKELDILAHALVEYEVLNLEEIQKVLRGEKLQKMKELKSAPLQIPELVLPPPPPVMGGGSPPGGPAMEGGRLGGGKGTTAPEPISGGGKGTSAPSSRTRSTDESSEPDRDPEMEAVSVD